VIERRVKALFFNGKPESNDVKFYVFNSKEEITRYLIFILVIND
jgi:hypothetical protein